MFNQINVEKVHSHCKITYDSFVSFFLLQVRKLILGGELGVLSKIPELVWIVQF